MVDLGKKELNKKLKRLEKQKLPTKAEIQNQDKSFKEMEKKFEKKFLKKPKH